MSSSTNFLENPHPRGHLVQLYEGDEQRLTRNVCNYLWEGLKRGEGLVVISTPEHRDEFMRQLQVWGDPDEAVQAGRLILLDAQQTLDRFVVEGQPNWERFQSTMLPVLRQLRAAAGYKGLRAYGEMVGLLWKADKFPEAIVVEEFWNKLLISNDFQLFCAYPIDIFGTEFEAGVLDGLLCAHTHLLPAGDNEDYLENAINRAMEEVLGPKAEELRGLIKANHRPSWAVVPRAEAMILWLRANLPEYADAIVAQACQHSRPSQQTAATAH